VVGSDPVGRTGLPAAERAIELLEARRDRPPVEGTHPEKSGRDARLSRRSIEGTALPFADQSFDVIISNHVLEHVGDRKAQGHHLAELRRVLRSSGAGYMAVPNRWSFVEPHFGLPFLSWLPPSLRSAYVRAARRGDRYDCLPPGPLEMDRMIAESGLISCRLTSDAIRIMPSVERVGIASRAFARMPRIVHRITYPIMPTMIFLLRRDDASLAG